MRRIETLNDLKALIGETYMYAVIIAVVALVLAFIIANLIKYQGGRYNTDHIKRRIWFIVIGVIAPIAFWLYNSMYVASFITRAPLLARFKTANLIATSSLLGIYVVLGIITMLLMRRSKWGSILGKSK